MIILRTLGIVGLNGSDKVTLPANIYMFKVNKKTLEKGVKHVQN